MVKLKSRNGQFMLISSVVIGMIIMTLAGSISEITSQQFEPDPTKYELNMIKDKSEKLDLNNNRDRERLRHTLDLLDEYNSEMVYWEEEECVNITLRRPGDQFSLDCIEGGRSKLDSRQNLIENFGNISHYTGDTNDYTSTGSTSYSGSRALTTESIGLSHIFTSQPNNLPKRGNLFRAMFRTDNAEGYGRMYFASQEQNPNNAYSIRISHEDGVIRLYKHVNGNEVELAEDTFNRYQMSYQWNFVEVNFGYSDNDVIEVYYYSEDSRDDPQATLSATDTEFNGGYIGWSLHNNPSGSTNIYWDYMHYPPIDE